MNITLVQTGKTHFNFVNTGFEMYSERIKHFCKFNYHEILLTAKQKTTDTNQLKKFEGAQQLKLIKPTDYLILLDEKAKPINSKELALKLNNWLNTQTSVFFLTGGAYGVSNDVYKRANEMLSLSALTFSHQLVKLIFAEQLYRSFTIINGLPYHHQ